MSERRRERSRSRERICQHCNRLNHRLDNCAYAIKDIINLKTKEEINDFFKRRYRGKIQPPPYNEETVLGRIVTLIVDKEKHREQRTEIIETYEEKIKAMTKEPKRDPEFEQKLDAANKAAEMHFNEWLETKRELTGATARIADLERQLAAKQCTGFYVEYGGSGGTWLRPVIYNYPFPPRKYPSSLIC